MRGSSAQFDPQKTEEAVDHRHNNNYVKAVGDLASAKQLVYSANCCFICCAEQSHMKTMSVATAAEEQLKQKVVQLSGPSSTSLFLISPGLS